MAGMEQEESGPRLDAQVLAGPVRQALREAAATVVTWDSQSIYHAILASTGGVYRVAGTAQVRGATVPWSLVLKVVRRPPSASPAAQAAPHEWVYWQREVLAYQSGLLAALPGGLRAPQCFGTVEQTDGVWLWLKDVADTVGLPWPMAQYGALARCLGAFNGAYAAGPWRKS